MDAIKHFLDLPVYVSVQGVQFHLEFFKNGTDDARLCYAINYADPDSMHYETYNETGSWYNPFTESTCSFLVLVENISDDDSFMQAIITVWIFLTKHGIK